jgi:hypothetical protein
VPAFAPGERQIDQVIAQGLGRKGTLYLTDRRLIFEYGEGMVNKTYHQFGVSLGDIQNINAEHPRFGLGQLVVTAQNSQNGFNSSRIVIGVVTSPEVWMGKINAVLNARSFQPPQREQPTVVLEKEVVRIPCRYCHTLVDAFRNSKCPNCGAPLY